MKNVRYVWRIIRGIEWEGFKDFSIWRRNCWIEMN